MRNMKKTLAVILVALLSLPFLCGRLGMTAGAVNSDQDAGDGSDRELLDIQAGAYDQPISRETFCNLVVTLFAERQETTVDELYGRLTDHQKTEAFHDIDEEDKYISLAKKYQLMEGTGSLNFSPSAAITKAEVACILRNLVEKLSPEHLEHDPDEDEPVTIEDQVELTDWSRDAAEFCVEKGLLKLDQYGNFDPTATITVGQATMLVSDVSTFLDTPAPTPEEGIPTYVWYIAGGCLAAVLLVVLVVVLVCRSRRKARAKAEKERQQETELNQLIAPSSSSSGAAGKAGSPRRTSPVSFADPEEETVYLRTEQPPKIQIIGAEVTDKEFDLFTPITIGRSKDCVLQLMDSTISRNHCRIVWRASSVLLEDTGARNPINVVRGAAVLPVSKSGGLELRTGDIIRVGSSELVITIS